MTEIGGYCLNCGASRPPGQNYCGNCGTAFGPADSPGGTFGTPVTGSDLGGLGAGAVSAGPGWTGPGAQGGAGAGSGVDAAYPREAVIGAVLLTVFMPFVALIAALILRTQELRRTRRDQLKNWAIASGAWLATGWVIGIVVFASALSAVGPAGCKGGVNQAVPPSYESSDGKHWVATFTCMNGGTITKSVPASQVPGGG